MGYDFLAKAEKKPQDKKFVLAVIALVAIGVIGVGAQITGQVTAEQSVCSSFDECRKIAESATSSLKICGDDRSDLLETKQNFESSISSCEKDRKYYTTSYVQQLSDYRTLVKNTAFEKCCTEDDVTRGSIKNFNVVLNSVKCNTEGYAINCRTGGTSY